MSTSTLQGVLDTGSVPTTALRVSQYNQQPIKLTQGETRTIFIDVITTAMAPVDLTGFTLTLTVRKNTADRLSAIAKNATLLDARRGRAQFVFNASDSSYLCMYDLPNGCPPNPICPEPGRYVYDVWAVLVDRRELIVPLSPFILLPSANPFPPLV